MDDPDEREALVLAVFAQPDDDLPRLQYADWLDEHGECSQAELIRIQCEQAGLNRDDPAVQPRWAELQSRYDLLTQHETPVQRVRVRGFRTADEFPISVRDLGDPAELRRRVLCEQPELLQAVRLSIRDGHIGSVKILNTILEHPLFRNIRELDFRGRLVEVVQDIGEEHPDWDQRPAAFSEYEYLPTVTVQVVEALVQSRDCRRFTHLDLRSNDLDNDAARAIVRSTNLTRMQCLKIYDGNQLRGRTWQELLDRFGEDVLE